MGRERARVLTPPVIHHHQLVAGAGWAGGRGRCGRHACRSGSGGCGATGVGSCFSGRAAGGVWGSRQLRWCLNWLGWCFWAGGVVSWCRRRDAAATSGDVAPLGRRWCVPAVVAVVRSPLVGPGDVAGPDVVVLPPWVLCAVVGQWWRGGGLLTTYRAGLPLWGLPCRFLLPRFRPARLTSLVGGEEGGGGGGWSGVSFGAFRACTAVRKLVKHRKEQ